MTSAAMLTDPSLAPSGSNTVLPVRFLHSMTPSVKGGCVGNQGGRTIPQVGLPARPKIC